MANYEMIPQVHNVNAEQITVDLMSNPRAWPQWMIDAWKKDPSDLGSLFIISNDYVRDQAPLMLRSHGSLLIEIGWNDYLIDAAGTPLFVAQREFERKYQLVT